MTKNKNDYSKENKTLLTEKNGTYGKEIFYIKPTDQNALVRTSLESSISENIISGFKNVFNEIFLPQGYPTSVSDDYINYQIWDTAQAFCSTVTGILATKAVLSGVGVGNADATPLAATITWVLKDGTGHVGRIGFAWWKGTSLDADSKIWRLVADCLNDAALCLELCLPLFIGYTTPVLCLSTAMKAIVGVAGGATRAALTQHHALRGNLGDVAAKDGSQETAVNLIASMIAILFISIFEENIWILFFFLTIMHIIFNYLAIKSVCLTTFNKSRFVYLINSYFKTNAILSPRIVNDNEVLFFGEKITEKRICNHDIYLGHSLEKLVVTKKISNIDLENSVKLYHDFHYLPIIDVRQKQIYIVLNDSITQEQILQAYYHALKLGILLDIHHNNDLKTSNESTVFDKKHVCKCLDTKNCNDDECTKYKISEKLNNTILEEWQEMCDNLRKSGWCLDKQFLPSQEWRAKW